MDINSWLHGVDQGSQVQDLRHTTLCREQTNSNELTGAQPRSDHLVPSTRDSDARSIDSHKPQQIRNSGRSSDLSDRPVCGKGQAQSPSYTRQKRRKTRPDRYEHKAAGIRRNKEPTRKRERRPKDKQLVCQPPTNKHEKLTRLTASMPKFKLTAL